MTESVFVVGATDSQMVCVIKCHQHRPNPDPTCWKSLPPTPPASVCLLFFLPEYWPTAHQAKVLIQSILTTLRIKC